MNFNLILTEKNNKIFNIILNDQKNQNTLSENMINELTSALDIADKDNDIKVIIKWIVSGKFHDKENVERAIIEKKEEEKMDLMGAQKND